MSRRRPLPSASPKAVQHYPIVVVAASVMAAAMYVPASHALILDDHRTARIFFYYGTFLLFVTACVGLATANHRPGQKARAQLLSMLAVFAVFPWFLALPVKEVIRDTSYVNAVLEMASALTTTGATVFEDPERLPLSLHLWRALVAWLGGLFMWVAAVAILAPLQLGGFEVSQARLGQNARQGAGLEALLSPEARLLRALRIMAPIYGFLTINLAMLLLIAGESGTHAVIHAMSTIATSGISAMGGVQQSEAGFWGEMTIFAFLIFAVSRQTFVSEWRKGHLRQLVEDRELRIAAAFVVCIPLALFLRHWSGVLEIEEGADLALAIEALWGSVFTVLSFLTTTGFESAGWGAARNWSGLATPGILLMGLALFGGGVATTAGGVKLLRVYALYRHGRREMGLLVEPHSVAGVRSQTRRVHPEGVQAAWIFFMLFGLSVALISGLFALGGQSFEHAMILTVTALSTTGPLLEVAPPDPISLADLGAGAKAVFGAAMILGRLETLAIVALLNPEFWRR